MTPNAIRNFNPNDLDPTRYREDFYEAVNGKWAARTAIPADHITVGGSMDLVDNIEQILRRDFEDLLTGKRAPERPEMAEFKKFYALTRDFDRRDADGTAPLRPVLQQIAALQDYADLSNQLADLILADRVTPVVAYLDADMRDTANYALQLDAPDLFLPDKTYYTSDNPDAPKLLAVYTDMATRLLEASGYTPAGAAHEVDQAKQFDALLAPTVKSSEELADDVKRYNPRPLKDVAAKIQAIDLSATITALLHATPERVIVTQPAYYDALNDLLSPANFPLVRSWMLVHTVVGAAGLLDEQTRQTGNAFRAAISGQKQAFSPKKAAYHLAASTYDQVVGDYYGRTYFGPTAKADVAQMVRKMAGIYEHRLANNDWLSPATRDKAILKLQKLNIKVGYPDQLDPFYAQLTVTPGESLFATVERFNRLRTVDEFAHWGQPVDRTKWYMSAWIVNAYYDPQKNEIVFPAGILQAPFYDLKQSSSASYGGIGAVIAHEISHAFDNNGAQFDENGNLHNWWTDADLAHFRDLSQAMIDEFNGIPYAGQTVNGKLTVSENIADVGGLSCALEAAKDEPNVDLEAFFISYALSWQMKSTTEYMQFLLAVDVHAPEKLRTNVQVENFAEFYQTFDVQPGDGMYLAPENRVQIW
ncbi:MAG TPA: M13 family peptidase [Candidatus Levilactobacillus faecigallinarum]|uniref:M13 family peptidase n=1 Tax=Candidatus Levilactobacillus faecigallinarum TaxID=2838638 RepID=A0A9D1QR08_9LACO|nr:M13 family peptidase [Candidatus Levilactobacillus faecigallinarum]